LKWFDYTRPHTLPEALALLDKHGDGARMLAGGTDLLVQLRAGRRQVDFLVDVKEVPELNALRMNGGGLTLGAAVPCYRIYRDETVSRAYRGLHDVATIIGGTQIQGRASIGGNLANAAPSADAIPILIAYGAQCRIQGPQWERTAPVEDFCTAPGKNVLSAGEMLVSLQLPAPGKGSGAAYLRFIPRNEMDIAVVGAGVTVTIAEGTIRAARVALAAVAPTPLYVPEAGQSLVGKPPTDENLRRAAEIAKEAARPISDMRAPAEYRRHLCAVLTRRALEIAVRRAEENQ